MSAMEPAKKYDHPGRGEKSGTGCEGDRGGKMGEGKWKGRHGRKDGKGRLRGKIEREDWEF